MSVKIRLARGGSKKRPYYRVVVAKNTSPRDGKFIEKVGTYAPLMKSDDPARITLKEDRIAYWLSCGAEPTERVLIFLQKRGIKLPRAIQRKADIRLAAIKAKMEKRQLEQQSKAEAGV